MAAFNYQDYILEAQKQMSAIQAAPDIRSYLASAYSSKRVSENSKLFPLVTKLSNTSSTFTDKEYNQLLKGLYGSGQSKPGGYRQPLPKYLTQSGSMVGSANAQFAPGSFHNSLPPSTTGLFGPTTGGGILDILGPKFKADYNSRENKSLLDKFNFFKGLTPDQSNEYLGKFSSTITEYNKKISEGPGLLGMLLRAAPGLLLGGLATGGLSALGNLFTGITGLAPSQVGTFGNLFSLLTGGANTARTGSSLIAGNIASPQFLASAAAGGTGLTGGGILSSLSGASLSDITRLLGAGTQLAGLFAKPPELPSASSSAFTPKATALLSRNDLAIQDSAAKVAQAERERRGRGATILTSGKGLIDQLGGINRPAGRQAELLG